MLRQTVRFLNNPIFQRRFAVRIAITILTVIKRQIEYTFFSENQVFFSVICFSWAGWLDRYSRMKPAFATPLPLYGFIWAHLPQPSRFCRNYTDDIYNYVGTLKYIAGRTPLKRSIFLPDKYFPP